MNKTVLGFVINVFGGRAGLFTATILPAGTNLAPITVRVSDLDGEPERFNERLLKVRLLREALTHAEPVEINYEETDKGGLEVNDVRRIGRTHHLRALRFDKLTGLVLRVRVHEQDIASKPEEAPDTVVVDVIDPKLGAMSLRLSMQMAERGVPAAMLDMIQTAYASGTPLEFMVALTNPKDEGEGEGKAQQPGGHPWIVAVSHASLETAEVAIDAFVESVSTCIVHGWPLATIYLRSAPAMTGVGRIVDAEFFRPKPFVVAVSQGSPMFALLDQARSEGVRVRVGLAGPRRAAKAEELNHLALPGSLAKGMSWSEADAKADTQGSRDPATLGLEPHLLVGVTVMAPLASAATPVWVRVQREALDGPPVVECAGGVPTSDLSGRGVMSLQVPHRAAWIGQGCFNPGVYRIQVVAPVAPRIFLDGKLLECVAEYAHVLGPATTRPPATEATPLPEANADAKADAKALYSPAAVHRVNLGGLIDQKDLAKAVDLERRRRVGRYLAHFCVCRECCHELRVEFQEWRCGYAFELDVFKLC